jgi:hypothetical protein
VIVTSDREEVVENESESVMKPNILREHVLREAKIENNGHSWIAAEIKVRHNIAAAATFMTSIDTTSSMMKTIPFVVGKILLQISVLS